MKTYHSLFLILIASLTMIASCKKENTLEVELAKLPPATQTGANTFGCLINGKVFIPKGYNGTGTPNPKITYNIGVNGLPVFSIEAKRMTNNHEFEGGVLISFQNIKDTAQYVYPKNFNFSVGWPTLLNSCGTVAFDSTILKMGEAFFTRYDPVNRIFSGTFHCKFKTLTCDTVFITDGRFDFKL